MYNRFPSKANSLAHISKFTGHHINTVIDVGILYATPELMNAFPRQKHVLIEPVQAFNDTINRRYEGMDYDLRNIAMSSASGKMNLELRNHLPNSPHGKAFGVTASNLVFDGKLKPDAKYVEVETDTLDNLCAEYKGPFVVKIDVDGAELEILKGMQACVGDVYWVVIEAVLSRLPQIVEALTQKGFQLWDIVDFAYMRAQLSQVDLVFVNRKLLNNAEYKEVSPRNFGFQSSGEGNYVNFKEGGLTPEGLVTLHEIQKKGQI